MQTLFLQGALDRHPFHGLQPPEKWALLYTMFNADMLGILTIKPALFKEETGLSHELLSSIQKKDPTTIFVADGYALVLDAVKDQYGKKSSAISSNKLFGVLCTKLVQGKYHPKIVAAFLERYPVFSTPYYEMTEQSPLPSFRSQYPKPVPLEQQPDVPWDAEPPEDEPTHSSDEAW